MAVLNREAFFEALQDRVGTDTSEDSIKFIEDMTDTFNALEEKANGDGVDWEAKYHELNESWKKKYARRFFSGTSSHVFEDDPTTTDPTASTIIIDDLFE